MPHGSLKIIPGVDTNKTPALNEAAVSFSNLVRFIPDRTGAGLVQKVGGWKRFVTGTVSYGVIRALKGWQDLQNEDWLAIGSEGQAGLQVYNATTADPLYDITPRSNTNDFDPGLVVGAVTYGISTTGGSNNLIIKSSVTPSSLDYVYFPTQVSVGNLLLYGPYQVLSPVTNQYEINVGAASSISTVTGVTNGADRDVTIVFAGANTFKTGQSVIVAGVVVGTATFNGTFTITSTTVNSITYKQTGVTTAETSYGGTVVINITNGGEPPKFTTTSGSAQITVDLANHGYQIGDDFQVAISTTVGGLTLFGIYTVVGVSNSYQFVIAASTPATSSTNAFENGGDIRQVFLVGVSVGALSDNSVYGGTGTGLYGGGVYSTGETGTPDVGINITATDWALDNWGQILIANPNGGAIYYWTPAGSANSNAIYIPNSPLYNEGVFVAMPQRQLVAYGSTDSTFQDPLLVRWSEVEDFSVWQGTAANLAGSYRIPTGSKIVGGIQANQQGLLWTDLDCWAMQFIGYPNAYGFNKIGANAGLIGRKAMTQLGGVVYWMSQRQFFRLAGSGPEILPCSVWDQIFQNIYPGTEDKIRCAANTQFGEITWYFAANKIPVLDANGQPAGGTVSGTGEVNAYVRFNVLLNQWDYGYDNPNSNDINTQAIVGRTAWIDQSVLGPPIGAATSLSLSSVANSYAVYQHEGDKNNSTYVDAESINGTTVPILSTFRTGYFALAEGDNQIFIDQVWPDMKWGLTGSGLNNAKVYITFYATNYPGDTPIAYGPYEMTQGTEYLSIRLRARLMSISLNSTETGTFWRIGNLRYRFQPDGRY